MTLPPAFVALCLVEHVGAKKLRALWTHFNGDLDAILKADVRALDRVPGIGVKLANAITRIDVNAVAESMARWEAAGVSLINAKHALYPAPLQCIADAPPLLFLRGDLPAGRTVAIVGTRTPSADALLTSKRIAYELGKRGWVIVSGMALGIDTGAHSGALAAQGKTVAVLGSGVLNPYPPQNRPLAQSVTGMISEVPPEAHPSPAQLVARNRLISGMSAALIVVETAVDGGAMHAARRAFEQGRPVFALDLAATGNQALAAEGARLCADADGLIAAVDGLEVGGWEGATVCREVDAPLQLPLTELI